jgi:hypothetical protein
MQRRKVLNVVAATHGRGLMLRKRIGDISFAFFLALNLRLYQKREALKSKNVQE